MLLVCVTSIESGFWSRVLGIFMRIALGLGHKEFLFFLYFFSENKIDLERYTSINRISKFFKIDAQACKKALTLLEKKSLLLIETQYSQSQGSPRKIYFRDEKLVGSFLGIPSEKVLNSFLKDIVKVRNDESLNNFQRAIILSFRYFEYADYSVRIVKIKDVSLFLKATERRVQSTVEELSNRKTTEIGSLNKVLSPYKAVIVSSHKTLPKRLDVKQKNDYKCPSNFYAFTKRYNASLNFELYKILNLVIQKLKITKVQLENDKFSLNIEQRNYFDLAISKSFFNWPGYSGIEELLTYEKTREILELLRLIKDDKNIRYFINEEIGKRIVSCFVGNKEWSVGIDGIDFVESLFMKIGKGVTGRGASSLTELLNIIFRGIITSIESAVARMLAKVFECEDIYLTVLNPLQLMDEPDIYILYGVAEANMIYKKKKPLPTLNLLGFNLWSDNSKTNHLGTMLLKFY